MKVLVILSLVCAALAAPKLNSVPKEAEPCDAEKCKLPACRCASTEIPGGFKADEVPQLVYLTFDDAVTGQNVEYYRKAFNGRKNPDGCPVQATFYISHEYTDYSLVNELYNDGHEIALHSITHKSSTSYWSHLSKEELIKEFGGEKQLLAHFANVPEEHIKGMRMPLLQLAGDNNFQAAKEIGLDYDCSWPTLQHINPGLWPYTLDYKTIQECGIPPCPESSIPGLWIQPMLDLEEIKSANSTHCSMVDACPNIADDEDAVFKFLTHNFERSYNSNRAPIGFYMHAAWFGRLPEHSFDGYVKFIDHLQTLKDVYIVGVDRGLDWVRNPVKLNGDKPIWPECQPTKTTTCTKATCELKKGEEYRYMTQCTACPKVYPWLDNPLGKQ